MKCLCGFEENPFITEDKNWIEIKGDFKIETEGYCGFRPMLSVAFFACPECDTIKLYK